MKEGALVKNAADEKQVSKAKDREENKRENELKDLAEILQTPQGRRFIWRLIEHCNVFSSVWRQSAEIHRLAGMQDVGHFILAEVNDSDQFALFKMMIESKKETDYKSYKDILKRIKEEL